MKINRNDLCPCGSGKKYKKCCINLKDLEQEDYLKEDSLDKKFIPMTTTHEFFIPIRLYYEVFDKEGLIKQLEKLKCVGFEEDNRFFISYFHEAKKFGLKIKHNQVPEEIYPIILADGHITAGNILHIDLRSFERGVCMVKFMDKHISQKFAKITYIACSNTILRLSNEEAEILYNLNYDELFLEKNFVTNEESWLEKLESVTKFKDNENIKELEKLFKQKLPLIEKFPALYYEKGISYLEFRLAVNSKVALEHFRGNLQCTPLEILFDIFDEDYEDS
jgi:hypothetical protein